MILCVSQGLTALHLQGYWHLLALGVQGQESDSCELCISHALSLVAFYCALCNLTIRSDFGLMLPLAASSLAFPLEGFGTSVPALLVEEMV